MSNLKNAIFDEIPTLKTHKKILKTRENLDFLFFVLRGGSHRKWHFSNLAYFETLGHEITKKIPPPPPSPPFHHRALSIH